MHLDWYDSHCILPALGFLKSDANTMGLFTENGSTDILAAPDGGLLKTLSGKTQQIIGAHLVDNYDTCFSLSTPDSMLRRKIIINAYGEAWEWFRNEHTDMPIKVALRTGNIFPLKKIREEQCRGCVFRGYNMPDGTPKNPFFTERFAKATKSLENSKRKKKKRKLVGGQKTFQKRRMITEAVLRSLQNN